MKALYELYQGLTFEVEADYLGEILDEVSYIRNAIGYEPCGKCGSEHVFPTSRQVGDDVYYELKCHGYVDKDGKALAVAPDFRNGDKPCNAVLQIGQNKNKKKTLYKKKMETDSDGKAVTGSDGKGKYKPNNGWVRYNPVTKTLE